MTVLPATTSTLSAKELGDFIQLQYSFTTPLSCSLFRTGMNHTYFLSDTEKRYAVRVYSHNWRSKTEILEELRLLSVLKKENLPISFPIPDRKGALIQEVIAPEGIRYVVVFSFAEGSKIRFLDKSCCFEIGKQMANFHKITTNQTIKRTTYDLEKLTVTPYHHLQKFFSEKLPEMRYIKEFGASCTQLNLDGIPTGITHMDLWYDNMLITPDKKITFFDFDFCGNGWLLLDIGYFCKQLFLIEADKATYEQKKQSFLQGYQSVRSISEKELALLPIAGSAVYIFYLGIQAQRFDWSNIFLTENYLKMMVKRITSWMDYQHE